MCQPLCYDDPHPANIFHDALFIKSDETYGTFNYGQIHEFPSEENAIEKILCYNKK